MESNDLIKKCVVKETQIGKYKSKLSWYKTEDGVWIDNSYFIRIEDNDDNLIEEIDKKRTDIPERAMPPTHTIIIAPSNSITKEPILIDTNNDFWIFSKKPNRPIAVWITLNKEIGKRKIIDVVTNEIIGYGTSPPIKSFSWSGPHNSVDVWSSWRKNAHEWFQKWSSNAITKGLAKTNEIKSEVRNLETIYYYAIAHGGYISSVTMDGTLRWYDIEESISNREPIWFAFLGHCGAMVKTDKGSFSYAFRKGSLKKTVTIGYINMGSCNGWIDSLAWQNKLFGLVDDGYTFKDAFDRATITYPRIESGVMFLGDEDIEKKEVNEMENVRRIDLYLKKIEEGEVWKVYGTLRNIDSNEGIGNATITLDAIVTTTTTIDGDFLFSDVVMGEHTIRATCTGYKDTVDTIKQSSVIFEI